jgi:1-deoxy-D-xylulose-5-phosphate reductoisomerase
MMPVPQEASRRERIMPKKVIILGSTGSIGCSALEVADRLPGEFDIVGLAAASRWQMMAEQIERYRPNVAVLSDVAAAEKLAGHAAIAASATQVWGGPDALVRLVKEIDCDFVLAGIVGVAGLASTLAAVRRGLTVGLANKESLVVAGRLMVDAAARSGALLLPVDSEHSAIHQSMQAGRHEEIERIILTASGGPFRTSTLEQMRRATPAEALRHPTWDMGPKITIDSATMMNKALEIVEAKWLFNLEPDRIEVVIHPESIIHSMVAFHDGSIIAQMGRPDMRTPIQYAMTYPQRLAAGGPHLSFSELSCMHFEPPDVERFPALRLGHQAARAGGTAGAAMNAGNEMAVAAFQNGQIGFLDIVPIVEDVLNRHPFVEDPDLETLANVEQWARNEVTQCSSV